MTRRPLIGILGGMGTAAGLYFQHLFFKICSENGLSGDQDYPEWLYLNASQAPDRSAAIYQKGPSPVPYLVRCLKRMQAAGVETVIVPCNAAHAFYEEIIAQVEVPWIHLVNETAKEVRRWNIEQIGILSTTGTLTSGLYQRALAAKGIEAVEPAADSKLQSKIMAIIYDPEFGVKFTGTGISEKARLLLQEVIIELNTDAIILGCTELSVAAAGLEPGIRLFDPLDIAARVLFEVWQGVRPLKK